MTIPQNASVSQPPSIPALNSSNQTSQPRTPAPSMAQVRNGEESFKQGQFGEPIFKLSSLLSSIGFLLAGPPSRSFGPVMDQAVKDFQAARDIKPTGQVDQRTLQEIDTAVASQEIQQSKPPVIPTPPQGEAQNQYPFVQDQS